jgi:hypothetical protein
VFQTVILQTFNYNALESVYLVTSMFILLAGAALLADLLHDACTGVLVQFHTLQVVAPSCLELFRDLGLVSAACSLDV